MRLLHSPARHTSLTCPSNLQLSRTSLSNMSANVKVHFVYSSSVVTATVKKETESGATHEWFKLNEALWSEQGVRGVQTVLGSPVKIQVGEKVTLNNAHMDFKSNHTRMADGTPQYT